MIHRFPLFATCAVLVATATSCNRSAPAGTSETEFLQMPDSAPPQAPALLAPGFISTANGERDAAFLPDLAAFYYTLWTGRFGVILEVTRSDEGWSSPAVAPFSGKYSDLEPFVTTDGARLFFASNRPVAMDSEPKDYDIWYVDRLDGAWSDPVHIGSNVNTPANEFYPSLDAQGVLYFTAAYENSVGGEDIWRSQPTDNGFGPRENAGTGVNTGHDEFNALIAPDGSFLAFSSFGRDDGLGGGDLYVSFRNDQGQFAQAVHVGAPINSESLDFSPALSPDGQTFLFSSRRSSIPSVAPVPRTYEELSNALGSPGNGDLDIYLVDASFLDSLNTVK